jgi:hypothetical protein
LPSSESSSRVAGCDRVRPRCCTSLLYSAEHTAGRPQLIRSMVSGVAYYRLRPHLNRDQCVCIARRSDQMLAVWICATRVPYPPPKGGLPSGWSRRSDDHDCIESSGVGGRPEMHFEFKAR